MNTKFLIKIVIDIGMMACLLLLMPYSLLGETAHEWIGMGMLVLFLLHHWFNRKWLSAVNRGAYSPYRLLQTALVIVMLLLMAGSMVSGILLSNHVFHFAKPVSHAETARQLHMLCAYWGFLVMSVHLGIHWNMTVAMAGRLFRKSSALRSGLAKGAAVLIAVYGIYAFRKRQIGNYLLLKNHFLFFNYGESVLLFMLDYLAVMSFVIWISYYISKLLKRINHTRSR